MSSARDRSGARERLAALLLRFGVRIFLKPALSPAVPLAWQRWWLRQLSRSGRPARGVSIQPCAIGGVGGEWLRCPAATAKGTILYLHGGGYCVGSAATHRAVTSRLARAAPVFAADYRLAPEHPFPAAVEDAVACYRALAEAGPVVVAGDSAGGGLALATALSARQRGLKRPAALVLFSPWIDLAMPWLGEHPGDAMLSAPWLAACARHYLAGTDPADPLASPIHGDLGALPPTLIQAGGDELLRSDAERLRDALARAGVTVRCEIEPARWHAFQLHAGMLPSAGAAVARAADFITNALQAAT